MYGTHEGRQDFFYTGSQLAHGQRRVKQVYGNVQQDRWCIGSTAGAHSTKTSTIIIKRKVFASISNYHFCGSGLFIPDPDFYPSRIPDPTTAPKGEGGEIFYVVLPFLSS
jgi:hypothetical protein